MGVCDSRPPITTVKQPSVFYQHCLDGNYHEVKQMMTQLTYKQLNQIEPNGDTALHAAVLYNHSDIVKLLLDSGCSRTTLNQYRKTAYQEAQTDDVRLLFDRSPSQRFTEENTMESFTLFHGGENNLVTEYIPENWLKHYLRPEDAHEARMILSVAQSSAFIRKIFQKRLDIPSKQSLNQLINTKVTQTHPMYNEVIDLCGKITEKTNVHNLLRLYTLETPIYGALQNQADSFTILLYLHLSNLRRRAYQGYTYRGAKMTDADIQAYIWASRGHQYILETRTVQSTSKNKSVAEKFSQRRPDDRRHSVLLVFDFPERCKTAIDLTKISNDLPSLSAYEKEEEVTLLPYTLFNVTKIETDSITGQYRIALRNVPVPKQSLLTA